MFGVLDSDSIFYTPVLGFFAFTGIPTSVSSLSLYLSRWIYGVVSLVEQSGVGYMWAGILMVQIS